MSEDPLTEARVYAAAAEAEQDRLRGLRIAAENALAHAYDTIADRDRHVARLTVENVRLRAVVEALRVMLAKAHDRDRSGFLDATAIAREALLLLDATGVMGGHRSSAGGPPTREDGGRHDWASEVASSCVADAPVEVLPNPPADTDAGHQGDEDDVARLAAAKADGLRYRPPVCSACGLPHALVRRFNGGNAMIHYEHECDADRQEEEGPVPTEVVAEVQRWVDTGHQDESEEP